MKQAKLYIRIFLLVISTVSLKSSYGQGRVVINEYMPWTLNGCGATAEFVELMNFGPGPIDIGCYILTDGDYSITLPPNTILQPGEYYVIAGQDVIPFPCGNIDSSIQADLNWNTCGCTSGPIPTTGDGFFTDGGFANEQMVLLDPNLKVVDAVIRDLPAEPSAAITTSGIGGCGSKTFDLDTMSINYEVLGMSTGRGNSFARKLDGDCGWVKDPQQSGNATNNTPGETSDVTYSLSIVQSMDCDETHGSIDIFVDVGGYTDPVFPMKYIIAYDSDNNNIFDFSDTYTYGADSTPPTVAITGLPLGRYRIVVESANGCFLQSFNVTILECEPPLPVQLSYFKLARQQPNSLTFEWLLGDAAQTKSLYLEKSMDGISFVNASALESLNFTGVKMFTHTIPKDDDFSFYRLRLVDKTGKANYSQVLTVSKADFILDKVAPNPVKHRLFAQISSPEDVIMPYAIYNMSGAKVSEGVWKLSKGINSMNINVSGLPKGIYQLTAAGRQLLSFRFVKH